MGCEGFLERVPKLQGRPDLHKEDITNIPTFNLELLKERDIVTGGLFVRACGLSLSPSVLSHDLFDSLQVVVHAC